MDVKSKNLYPIKNSFVAITNTYVYVWCRVYICMYVYDNMIRDKTQGNMQLKWLLLILPWLGTGY